MSIIYRIVLILIVFMATTTYKLFNIDGFLFYIPLIFINYYFIKNLIDYILCQKRKKCQQTNELKTGIVFSFLFINMLIISVIYGFNFNNHYAFMNIIDYSLVSMLYNPLVLFYLFKKEIYFLLSKHK